MVRGGKLQADKPENKRIVVYDEDGEWHIARLVGLADQRK